VASGAARGVERARRRPGWLGDCPQLDGDAGLTTVRADGRLDKGSPIQAERCGGLLDLCAVPGKALRQAGVAELLVRPLLEEGLNHWGHALGPDIAIEVDNLAVVEDHRDYGGDRLATDWTDRVCRG
jgi:hypothetical protein